MKRVVVVPLLAAGTLFLGGGGCDSGSSLADRTTPQEIRGLWGADQESYAGRNLEIFENGLVFHTGDGGLDFTVHMIKSLASKPAGEGTGTAFEIEYLVEGTVFTFSFTYKPDEDAIFFKNQPQLRWTRVESEG